MPSIKEIEDKLMVKLTAKLSFMELKKIHISDIGKVVTGKTPRTSIVENYGGDIPFLTPIR